MLRRGAERVARSAKNICRNGQLLLVVVNITSDTRTTLVNVMLRSRCRLR
jgi:hypothetical protein